MQVRSFFLESFTENFLVIRNLRTSEARESFQWNFTLCSETSPWASSEYFRFSKSVTGKSLKPFAVFHSIRSSSLLDQQAGIERLLCGGRPDGRRELNCILQYRIHCDRVVLGRACRRANGIEEPIEEWIFSCKQHLILSKTHERTHCKLCGVKRHFKVAKSSDYLKVFSGFDFANLIRIWISDRGIRPMNSPGHLLILLILEYSNRDEKKLDKLICNDSIES